MKRTIVTALIALTAGLLIGHSTITYGMPWQESSLNSGVAFQPIAAWCVGVEVRGTPGIFGGSACR